jgi:5-methylcytosine-specific restriction protein A
MARLQMLGQRLTPATPKTGGWQAPHRGSATERGYGWEWEKARRETLKEQGGLCQPCLRRGHVTPNCRTVDHIVPKARGGTDAKANRQTICDPCHARKTQAESRGQEWDESAG